jgi:Tol biopolymer transport system component
MRRTAVLAAHQARRQAIFLGAPLGLLALALVAGAVAGGPKYAGKIAFYSDRDGPFDIYVMKADGSDVRRLTTSGDAEDVGTSRERAALWPRWSPDGKRIVFQSGKPDITQGQVYVMNGDGSGVRRLTSPSTGPNILPAWSPKGSTIAFASARDGYPRIYVMDARGRDQRPLTAKGVIGISPAWAPDGKRLAFSCMRGGRVAICAATMPAGRLAAVWKAPANFGVLGLDWSPDGRRILFMGTRGQAPDIYAVGADGKGLRRLTTDPANDNYPAWSPDGRHIVFASNRSGGTELYVMNADGSNQTRLTTKEGHDEAPDWAGGAP